VNQYIKLDRIGRGANSKVFAAFDRDDSNFYAMKCVNLEAIARSRNGVSQLEREIKVLQSLSHPNVISLREVLHVKPRDSIYIITSLANCGSLKSVLGSQNLSFSTLRYIFKCLASAIWYLHSQRLIHQDIKPANVLLSSNGSVLLSDFGLCHGFETPSVSFGSPLYNAPESLDPDPGATENDRTKEDVWSLGVTLYEMLFGVTPFRGRDVYEIIASITEKDLVAPSVCDKSAWELVQGMLQKNPKERFGMKEVMESEFVKNAPEFMDFAFLRTMELPTVDRERPIMEQSGEQCGPECKLEPLLPKQAPRTSSLPFYCRRARAASSLGVTHIRQRH
jgi:serine/threonine-protein kinase 11